MENEYQITKTIRFGLTLKRIVNGSPRKNPTHTVLDSMVKKTEDSIIGNKKNIEVYNEKKLIEMVSDCFQQINAYIRSWNQVYNRTDQISLTKEYYKIMAKKACFDGFWTDDKGFKKPATQLIKLSSLRRDYYDLERKEYIIRYWTNNLSRINKTYHEFDIMLKQYKNAINEEDKAHKKPHLVDFRKIFLSLCNQINESLIPLTNDSIVFADIDKLSEDSRNEVIKDFASKEARTERRCLLDKINEIKTYFESNGGYAPYGKVTFNKYTAQQKPHDFSKEIKDIIQDLQLVNLIKKLIDMQDDEITDYLQRVDKIKYFELLIDKRKACSNDDNKLRYLKELDKSIIQIVQMFKCKAIPASVRYALADYMQRNFKFNKEKVLQIFEKIGEPVSPSCDYAKLKDEEKDNFSLDNYPIKLAFDYAWENLARSVYREVKFPKVKCEVFLRNNFNVDYSSESFELYADLLCLSEDITTLEYGQPNNPADIISEIDKIIKKRTPSESQLQEVYQLNKQIKKLEVGKNKYDKIMIRKKNPDIYSRFDEIKHMKTISYNFPKLTEATKDYLIKSKTEKELIRKNNNNRSYIELLDAKQEIGLLRGSQKNQIKAYYNFTQVFKDLSSTFGKSFADLRDKFREENELNKITHCGIIIEDKKNDKYVLLQGLNSERNSISIYDGNNEGELRIFQVKSLTSKTLIKLVKNRGSYPDFHISNKSINTDRLKKEWNAYQDEREFLDYLKKCLTSSEMAKIQNWSEFGWNLEKCNKYHEIEKEIDQKSYLLQVGTISQKRVEELINEKSCLLLPIVNQDITSITRENKNQFSKDWQMIFDANIKEYRLHPELSIVYRHPTPDYPKREEKRYSRFQMIANMQCEIFPQTDSYVSRKEQIAIFNDKEKQQKVVDQFTESIQYKDDFYIIGIDRGIKQLATLCVLNSKGEIQGDFEIYTREFDKERKQWIHKLLPEKRGILDLSNLRVETTVEGSKVLVDLSLIKTKDKQGIKKNENLQTIKLKQLSYIRKLQYKMQYDEEKVIAFYEKYKTDSEIEDNIKDLIKPYKEGPYCAHLPIDVIKDMLHQYYNYVHDKDQKAKRELCELDAADNLKSGIVANMVGVVTFLLEKYQYKAYISLENLCRAYHSATDGLTGQIIPSSFQDPEIDFKEQENLVLAGVGTYRFFEMQLLKKLFKIQQKSKIINLVPAFRSVDNYEKVVRRDKKNNDDKYTNYLFGIVRFVDPKNTSKRCPSCGSSDVKRINNVLSCKKCGFSTADENKDSYLRFIKNGDDNGAYNIARKFFENYNASKK